MSRRSNSLQYEELSASARAHAHAVNQLLLAEGYDCHGDVMLDPLAPLSTRSLSLGSSILQQQLKELQHLQAHALDLSEEAECGGPGGGSSAPDPSADDSARKIFYIFEPTGCFKEREDFSLWFFPPENRYIPQKGFRLNFFFFGNLRIDYHEVLSEYCRMSVLALPVTGFVSGARIWCREAGSTTWCCSSSASTASR